MNSGVDFSNDFKGSIYLLRLSVKDDKIKCILLNSYTIALWESDCSCKNMLVYKKSILCILCIEPQMKPFD